jgi:hypothetical protein
MLGPAGNRRGGTARRFGVSAQHSGAGPWRATISVVDDANSARMCSAKGCRRDAVWAVIWNNPKIHTADREKVWSACDEHKASLSQFLSARGFLKRVETIGS